jgi:hypothetical protein
MRTRGFTAAAVLVASAGLLIPASATAAPVEHDNAAGSGTLAAGDMLSLGANGTVDGANGMAHYKVPDVGTILVDVTCLQVTGNSAVFAGTVRRATGAFEDRTDVKGQVIDNGADPDLLALSTQQGVDCNVPPPQVFHEVVSGNFVVHDR